MPCTDVRPRVVDASSAAALHVAFVMHFIIATVTMVVLVVLLLTPLGMRLLLLELLLLERKCGINNSASGRLLGLHWLWADRCF